MQEVKKGMKFKNLKTGEVVTAVKLQDAGPWLPDENWSIEEDRFYRKLGNSSLYQQIKELLK